MKTRKPACRFSSRASPEISSSTALLRHVLKAIGTVIRVLQLDTSVLQLDFNVLALHFANIRLGNICHTECRLPIPSGLAYRLVASVLDLTKLMQNFICGEVLRKRPLAIWGCWATSKSFMVLQNPVQLLHMKAHGQKIALRFLV
jgi:hypothetical protein